MAGEVDDDYMGDLSIFLPPEEFSSLKKKFISKATETSSSTNHKRPKTNNWMDRRKIEKERKQREEDAQTKARLEASIPESNLGFRMLRQMGYKPGTALGKDGDGVTVPVGLEIRRSRAGIGRETPHEAAERKEREAMESFRVIEQEVLTDFGSRQRMQWMEKKVASDYRKAEATLAQLENRDVLEAQDDDKEKEEEEEEVVITQEDLHRILVNLREEHLYCLYCGCKYESAEELQCACPGLYEEDH